MKAQKVESPAALRVKRQQREARIHSAALALPTEAIQDDPRAKAAAKRLADSERSIEESGPALKHVDSSRVHERMAELRERRTELDRALPDTRLSDLMSDELDMPRTTAALAEIAQLDTLLEELEAGMNHYQRHSQSIQQAAMKSERRLQAAREAYGTEILRLKVEHIEDLIRKAEAEGGSIDDVIPPQEEEEKKPSWRQEVRQNVYGRRAAA